MKIGGSVQRVHRIERRGCVNSIAEPSRNPAGRLRGSRNKLSEEVICALLRDFRKHGEKAIAKVRREQPGVYLRCPTLLVPREHKVERSNPIKDLTDEELEASIAMLKEMIAKRDAGANAKVIEGEAEAVLRLPGPDVFADRPVKAAADNGVKESKPRKRPQTPV